MALIFCERLSDELKSMLCVRQENWQTVYGACLVLSK
jgi:hypothetical protein